MPRTGRPAPGKSKAKPGPTQIKDWHASLGGLALKAEKATDSLERMLAVCRSTLAFLNNLLRPGTRYQDTPCIILGQHYLSHRELGIFHRGDLTRVYLQELCTYDPVEAPIPCASKYRTPGHTDVATWKFNIQPVAHAKLRKEGSLLNSTGIPYIEVALQGERLGQLEFTRHAETYQITSLPSILLAAPLQEQCPLDFDGICNIECAATGLRAVLKFKPWVQQQQQEGGGGGQGAVAAVKGEVRRLLGDGDTKIAKFEGHWQNRIIAQGLENNSEGVLFDIQDFPPVPTALPPSINLANPGPRTVARFWSAVIEAILYLDKEAAEKGGKSVVEMVNSLLTDELRKSLLYTPPSIMPNGAAGINKSGGGGTKEKNTHEDAGVEIAAQDSRPLPPAIRLQRALGRCLSYQLQYVVQSLTQAALEKESAEMEAVKIAVAAESVGGGGGGKMVSGAKGGH